MTTTRKLMLTGLIILPLFGVGVASVMSKTLTKSDEISLKQQMRPQDAGELTRSIGMFVPGFESELNVAKAEYTKAYGEGNFQVLDYDGYILLVPPKTNPDDLADAKAQVATLQSDHNIGTPDVAMQEAQITEVRDVFGVQGEVIYNTALGAYTDEKGFQYNFLDGKLISKQVGITSALQAKFEVAYPYLQPGVTRTAAFSASQARTKSDQMIGKLFGNGLATNAQSVDMGDARVGFVYEDNQVHVLVDRVSGDIINYNQEIK